MKLCEKCRQVKDDWLMQEVEPDRFICITCGTEIVKKHWKEK